MRVVIQRVSEASVSINSETVAQIQRGLMILLGIESSDTQEDIDWLSRKTLAMRIFGDDEGKMNRSVTDIDGEILVVSQFTLHASTKKGNRPGFTKSAAPDIAIPLYESFKSALAKDLGKPIPSGEFGADMQISLINDGPVTIVIDSKARE